MQKAFRWMLWAALLLVFAWACYFMPICNETLMDSDMASDMILAHLLSQEGGILSTKWYYSTELHVLHTQLISAPLFWITDNWYVVHTASNAILYLLLLLSAYYCCRQLRIRKGFPVVGILLMTPLNVHYTNNILSRACYIPYLVISFCLMGMLLQQARTASRWKRSALVGGAALLSFGAGLGGMRQPVVFHAPFLLATIYLCVYTHRNAEKGGPALAALSRRLLTPSILAAVMAGAGTLINEVVLARYYTFDHYKLSFIPFDLDRVIDVLRDTIGFFGYQTGEFSIRTILGFLLTVGLWGVALSVFVRHWAGKSRNDNPELTVLVVFTTAAMLVLTAIYAFTTMHYGMYGGTYLVPALVFVHLILGAGVERINWRPLWTKGAAALMAAALVLFSGLTWRICALDGVSYLMRRVPADELKVIADELVEQGYRLGYSAAWHGGNTMTQLSSGALDMYVWSSAATPDDADGIDHPRHWLQLTAHDTPPDPNEPFFIMLYMPYADGTPYLESLDDSAIVFTTDNYRIYGYENRAAYDSSLKLAE